MIKEFLIDCRDITLSIWLGIIGALIALPFRCLELLSRRIKNIGTSIIQYSIKFDAT